jgi:hypothetical protein
MSACISSNPGELQGFDLPQYIPIMRLAEWPVFVPEHVYRKRAIE